MRNHSNENEFDLHENGHVGETHFHMNGFAPVRFETEAKGNSEMAYYKDTFVEHLNTRFKLEKLAS